MSNFSSVQSSFTYLLNVFKASFSGLQSFWHQGLVLQKSIFPQVRGGGFRMIQVHYTYCVVYFCYYYLSSTSNLQALDPRGWGPHRTYTFKLFSWIFHLFDAVLCRAFIHISKCLVFNEEKLIWGIFLYMGYGRVFISFLHVPVQLSQSHLLKRLSFLYYVFLPASFAADQFTMGMQVYLRAL